METHERINLNPEFLRKFRYWIGAFILLNIMDALLTTYAVVFSGFHENNPLARFFTDMGILPFLFFKLVVVIAVVWAARTEKTTLGIKIATFIYAFIVLTNIWWLI